MRSLRQVWAKTFDHGVHPEEMKHATRGLAIERMPFVEEYVLPLSQHTNTLHCSGARVIRNI